MRAKITATCNHLAELHDDTHKLPGAKRLVKGHNVGVPHLGSVVDEVNDDHDRTIYKHAQGA